MGDGNGLRRATGRDRKQWFSVLDSWGAAGRPYREIAAWLRDEHGLSKWWAQKLIVEYEQERGIRPPGVRPDGTFEVTASKTVGVPVDRAFEAFVNTRQRKKWLTKGSMSLVTSQAPRSARFDWDDSPSRVNVTIEPKGPSKSTVAVAHARLSDVSEAESAKDEWRGRLAELKTYLES